MKINYSSPVSLLLNEYNDDDDDDDDDNDKALVDVTDCLATPANAS